MTTKIIAKSVLFHGDKILLVRRSKSAPHRALEWDLPGGLVEEGEELNIAAAREIEEETGIAIQPEHLDLVFTNTDSKKYGINIVRLFYVGKVDNNHVTISHEHDEHTWVTLDEAIAMPDGYETHQELFAHIRDNNLLADLPL